MSTSHVAASSSSSSIEIVGKGIAMGFLHVMAGPDHLSALATLSSNLGNCKAFQLGVRWGIGHSAGEFYVGLESTHSKIEPFPSLS